MGKRRVVRRLKEGRVEDVRAWMVRCEGGGEGLGEVGAAGRRGKRRGRGWKRRGGGVEVVPGLFGGWESIAGGCEESDAEVICHGKWWASECAYE